MSYLLNTLLGRLALRLQKLNRRPARTSSAKPPTTPPAMAPTRALVDRTDSEPFADVDEDSVATGDADVTNVVTDTGTGLATGSGEPDAVGLAISLASTGVKVI